MKTILAKLRNAFIFLGSHVFAHPYLPDPLIWIGFLLAATGVSLTLVAQPYYYWFDFQRAVIPVDLIASLLKISPLVYLAASLLCLAVLWAAFKFLTRSVAFLVWLPISFMNLFAGLDWLLVNTVPESSSPTGIQEAIVGIVAAFLLAALLVLFLFRRQRPATSIRTGWRKRLPMALVVLWGFILACGIAVSALHPWTGWQRVQPQHSPGARAQAGVAYDTVQKNTILFGGVSEWLGYEFRFRNDTWAWDGRDWKELHPENSPTPRSSQGMAYDEKRQVIVLFGGEGPGGYTLGDTWIWDGKDWTPVYPSNSPDPRRTPVMFYDPTLEKVIMAGGFARYGSDRDVTDYQDAWAWDGNDWSLIENLPPNSYLRSPGAAYDAVTKQMVVMNFNGPWIWQAGHWTPQNTNPVPTGRVDTWMAASPAGEILLFGGKADTTSFNDTWLLGAGRWQRLSPWAVPAPRSQDVLFYDPASRGFMLYGGIDSQNNVLSDMWALPTP